MGRGATLGAMRRAFVALLVCCALPARCAAAAAAPAARRLHREESLARTGALDLHGLLLPVFGGRSARCLSRAGSATHTPLQATPPGSPPPPPRDLPTPLPLTRHQAALP